MVGDHLSLETTPGVAVGIASLPGFRWREIIDMFVRREVTDAKEGPECTD
jgi:hypothetical protein